MEIARKIYDLREAAGLTQRQLGSLIGTTASVICRLEDADYEGHSLAMLNRIAAALNKRVKIEFVPLTARSNTVAVSLIFASHAGSAAPVPCGRDR